MAKLTLTKHRKRYSTKVLANTEELDGLAYDNVSGRVEFRLSAGFKNYFYQFYKVYLSDREMEALWEWYQACKSRSPALPASQDAREGP